jgi:protein-disulfide isomerase
MDKKVISIEFFFAGGCEKCAAARDALRDAVQATRVARWTEIDIGREPNRAVDVGVLSTPAVAIDGELLFKSMPSRAQLKKAIAARAAKS